MGKYDLNSGNIISAVQSTFVDPGVETFKQAALLYKQTYDKNKDSYNLTKRAMAQMELMPGDEKSGLRDKFVGEIDSNFEGVLESGAFEDATSAVQQNIDYVMTDKTVLQAQRNSLEFKKEEALIDQFGPSGILDFNKGLRESFTTVTKDEEGNEVVNSYSEEMEQKEDYNAYMKTLIGTIADSGGGSAKGIDINKDDVMDYLQTGNTKGVSQSKMERVVTSLMEGYLDSKVGDQDMRRLTQIEGMSEGEARIDILNRMKGMGQAQVGMITTVTNQQYKLGANYGASNKSGLGTDDNWAINTLMDNKTQINSDVFAAMTGNENNMSEDIKGGINISGQEGIVTDYSKFLGQEAFTNMNNELVKNGLAPDAESAQQISESLLEYLNAENSGDQAEQKRIAADMGLAWDDPQQKKQLQELSLYAKRNMDTEQLKNMGSMLNVPVSGVFKPNTGTTANAQWINGNAVIDGEYWFTEEQMDEMAAGSGGKLAKTDWMFTPDWFGATDIDNIKDAQGNKIFRKETKNDTEYFVMSGKSQRIAGDKITGDALYLGAGHSPTQYKDQEQVITSQRAVAIDIAKASDHAYQYTVNKSPGMDYQTTQLTKKALNSIKRIPNILGQPNPSGVYRQHATNISNLVTEAVAKGSNSKEVETILSTYISQIGKKPE